MKNCLTLFCVAAGSFAACQTLPANTTDNPTANWVEVSPGIFRGARPDEVAIKRLAQMGFKTVLNLEDDPAAVAAERAWTDAAGLAQVSHPMTGTQSPDDTTVAASLQLLDDAGVRPIFVHCLKGQDRTGAIIALHRVFNEGWSASDAHAEMMSLGFNNVLLAMKEYVELKIGMEQ